jgi:hypothetical protein
MQEKGTHKTKGTIHSGHPQSSSNFLITSFSMVGEVQSKACAGSRHAPRGGHTRPGGAAGPAA